MEKDLILKSVKKNLHYLLIRNYYEPKFHLNQVQAMVSQVMKALFYVLH